MLLGSARIFVVVALVALTPAMSSAQSAPEAAGRVHEAGGYADRLPVQSPEGGGIMYFGGGGDGSGDGSAEEARRREERARQARARQQPRSIPSAPALGGSSGFSYAILVLIIVAVVLLFGFVLVSLRPRGGELAPPRVVLSDAEPVDVAMPIALLDADPDALAKEGRYAEAIASALLRGLGAVGWRPEGHGKSRTAREILTAVASSDARKRSLAELVSIQERVAFGGGDASEHRWREARQHWVALTRPAEPT